VNAIRIAAVIGAAVISATAGTAGAAFASDPARLGATAVQVRSGAPGAPDAMTGICQQVMREHPAMARGHGQVMRGTRGLGQMNQPMTGAGRHDGRGVPRQGSPGQAGDRPAVTAIKGVSGAAVLFR